MIVDAHLHIWDKIAGRVGGLAGGGGGVPVEAVGGGVIRIGQEEVLGMPATFLDCAAGGELVLAEFDAAGVDAGVIVQEYLDGPQNEYLQKVKQQFPNRFFMYGLIDLFDTTKALERTENLWTQGFEGLKICGGHLNGAVKLDDAGLMSAYAYVAQRGGYLSVDLSEGCGQVKELERIVDAFPELKIAVGHFGMPTRKGWPGQLELARHPNVMLESGGIIWLYRNEGYPFEGAIDAIIQAKNRVGIEKLMWGSDWPRTMVDFTYRQSLEFVALSERLTDEEKKLFLGENARAFYGLEKPKKEKQARALITQG